MKTLIVDTLATVRLTRLVLADEITEPLRDCALEALVRTGEERPELKPVTDKLEYFLSCPWCVSIWTASALFILRKVSPETAEIVNTALAASAITGAVYDRYIAE